MERNVYLPQQKTFLFVKVICCVQAVRYLTLWLKLLNNRTHRVTEGTEVTQCYGGADGTKSKGDAAYRFLIRFKLNALCIITLTKFANMLRRSTHRRCLRNNLCCVFNTPPSSPCLRVTLLQTLNTSGKPYHSNILKTQPFHFKTSKISADKDLKNHYISSKKTSINNGKNTCKSRFVTIRKSISYKVVT